MKIDLQTVLIAAALLGAGALVLMPRRQAADTSAPPLQMSGAGSPFTNMATGAFTKMDPASYLPSPGLAALNVHGNYIVPSMYVDGLGQWAR